LPCTTSGQETEQVYSYNRGACTGRHYMHAYVSVWCSCWTS